MSTQQLSHSASLLLASRLVKNNASPVVNSSLCQHTPARAMPLQTDLLGGPLVPEQSSGLQASLHDACSRQTFS